MFENAGQKIKTLAKICFWIFAVLFVVLAFTVGISRWGRSSRIIPAIFWPFLIGGPLLSYIGSLFLYGFGELIESSEETKKNSARAGKYCEKLYNMLKDEKEPQVPGKAKTGNENNTERLTSAPRHERSPLTPSEINAELGAIANPLQIPKAPAAPTTMPKNLDAGGWKDLSE